MSIFNSLGSSYTRSLGVYNLHASRHAPSRLQIMLAKRYGPEVYLTYKGREAIALVLRELGLPAGSFVAVNGYTCYAVYQAIVAAGLVPLYLDIGKKDLNFSLETLKQAHTKQPNISAVMIQNTLGIPCDIVNIRAYCSQYRLALIEDLAHSIGLVYDDGAEAGTVGHAAALSFSQDKVVDAVSGGAAIIHNPKQRIVIEPKSASLWHRILTRAYPWKTLVIRKTFASGLGKLKLKIDRTFHLLPGPMSGDANIVHQLPAWHSRVALHGYEQLEAVIKHRQKIAEIYEQNLPKDIQPSPFKNAIYLRFPILVDKPLELINELKKLHVYLSDRWYDAPIAPARFLNSTNYKGECPNAEYVAGRMVNLPTHVHVSEDDARKIAERITTWLTSK